MTRILVCAMAYPPDILGGGEISTRLLAEGLAQKGCDVSVLTFTDQCPSEEVIGGVKVRRIACPNVYWSLRSDHQNPLKKIAWHLDQAYSKRLHTSIASQLAAIQPDIVHSSTIEDFGVKLWRHAKAQGSHVIHTLRSQCLLHRSGNMFDAKHDRFLKPDFLSIPKRAGSQFVDGVVGISNDILTRHLEHGFFPNAVTGVIGNPFEGPPNLVPKSASDVLRIAILGRIEPDKGIEPFLETLKAIENGSSLRWSLRIAGKGNASYVDHLKRCAAGLPVEFVGWADSREFLSECDVLAIPSRCYEAFGRGVVEAYSVGVPVICLRRGGLPELIDHGTTGWIFDEWSTAGLVEAFRGCERVDREKLLAHAKRYTVKAIADQYMTFYNRVLCR